MSILWQKLIKKILFGKLYCVSFMMMVHLALSCKPANNNSALHKVHIELPDDFYAVGLVYHRFGDNRYPSTNTSTEKFEAHLKYLSTNGFKSYRVSEMLNTASDTLKKVFITIDDGLKSFYTNGWPLLKKYNCKATLFVNTESVGWGDYINWQQLKELHKAGIEIGSHSHKHTYFLNYSDSLRVVAFKKDLKISEQLFNDSLGCIPKAYAYPYGEFDGQMAGVLKSRGYKLAFAQNSGVWGTKTNLYAIPRFPVAGKYVEMQQFVQKVQMKPMQIEDSDLWPIKLRASKHWRGTLYLYSTQQLSQENKALFQRINCFFNNKANNKVCEFYKDSIVATIKMPANNRRVLLTLTAKDKSNQWYWWSKLFVNTEVMP